MILAKATGYGIRALAYLARLPLDRLCGLREIAAHEHIPPLYLRKILGELRRHRLLQSAKGIHGGYRLAQSPDAITLWDVYRVLEPEPNLDLCILGRGTCGMPAECPVHEDWLQLRSGLLEILQKRTIAEMANSEISSHTLDSRPSAEVTVAHVSENAP